MKLVSIVILNWNGKGYLKQFLPALLRYSDNPGVEVVIADNASTDGSVEFLEEAHPGTRIIRMDRNHGFSGGYNRAFQEIHSKYFLLLNSDIEVTPGWLDPLVEKMEKDGQVAACTPKIKDFHNRSRFEYAGAAGGYVDRFGYPFCRGRIFDHLEEDHGQYDADAEVFWGSGACLLVRSELYRKAGGLDEAFFAHMEEIDLCWRLKRMGYRVEYVAGSTVYHVGGGTLERGNPMKTFLNFRNNLLLLYKNLPEGKRGKTVFLRMLLDGISSLRFLLQGAFKDGAAVLRAHFAFYGMKSTYKGTVLNKSPETSFIFAQLYPGSIVVDYFLKGRKQFDQIQHRFKSSMKG